MKTWARIVIALLLLVMGAAGGVTIDRMLRAREAPAAAADDEEEPEPAAVVHTVAAKEGELSRSIEGFGVAAFPPSAIFAESWPADVTVSRVLVQAGEQIAKGAPFAEVHATRETETQLAAAQLAVETTRRSLDLAHERFEHQLATRVEVQTAQSASDEAVQRLDRLRTGIPPADGLLRAHVGGLVTALRAQAGATVAAGAPILESASGDVMAQIGFDPADAGFLSPGQHLDVTPVDDRAPGRWDGSVSLIAPAVNPATRLIDTTLALRGDALPRAGVPLRARAEIHGAAGVLVPRAAITPDGDAMVMFIVRDGKAKKTPVVVSMRGRDHVLVKSGCASGDRIIVSGQTQLGAGDTVREVADDAKSDHPDGGSGAGR